MLAGGTLLSPVIQRQNEPFISQKEAGSNHHGWQCCQFSNLPKNKESLFSRKTIETVQ